MAEEQGLSGGNWTPSEIVRLWAFEVCGKRIHYSTAQRLVNQLNAARSEGPLPVGGEAHDLCGSGAQKRPSLASAGVAATPSGGWQDIASAPRDGTPILAFCVHANARYAGEDFSEWTEIVLTRWIDFNGGGWTWHGICGVHTHWRPLPAPPTDCQTSGGGE